MKLVYKAADGTEFGTEAECRYYESTNKLHNFIDNHFTGFTVIETYDVKTFIEQHIDEIVSIVKGKSSVTSDDGWISNENREVAYPPDGLELHTLIEVRFRNGTTGNGPAARWRLNWISSDNAPYDIIAYRIVK